MCLDSGHQPRAWTPAGSHPKLKEDRKNKRASKYLSIFKFSSSLKIIKIFYPKMCCISEIHLENQLRFCYSQMLSQ